MLDQSGIKFGAISPSNLSPEVFWVVLDGPRGPQGGPQGTPMDPECRPKESQWSPGEPKGLPKDPQWAPWGPQWTLKMVLVDPSGPLGDPNGSPVEF